MFVLVAVLNALVTLIFPEVALPVTTTLLPGDPLAGLKEVITGGNKMTKSVAEVPVPAGVVTDIFPVVAPAGTLALICVADTTV